MENQDLTGIGDWLSSAWSGVKGALGLGKPTAIQGGMALTQAKALYTYCYPGRVLKKGDRGDWVSILQFLLDLLGYRTYSGASPDGIFGNMVFQGVQGFQKDVGLIPNGEVGRYTSYYLYKTIEQQTKMAGIVPNLTNAWVQKKILKNPTVAEYVQAAGGQIPSQWVGQGQVQGQNQQGGNQPVFTPAVVKTSGINLHSPILWGGLLIIAALLLMRKD